jgi:DNA-binding NarL/FixJ family response regulator
MKDEIRVVIADDHTIFRQGLRRVIEEAGLVVVAEAADGSRALEQIRALRPHVAVLDIDMPLCDGFAVARCIHAERLPVEIVFLTMHKDELHLEDALQLGVRGYIVKDGAVSEVAACIRAIHSGGTHISPALSTHLLQRARRTESLAAEQPAIKTLTQTERRLLILLADCKTSKDIAAELGISNRTVENHRAHICEKLNLHGPHALVKFAMLHKSALL